jgi:hypothetical protein
MDNYEAVWRNTERIASKYKFTRAQRINLSTLTDTSDASCQTALRVYYYSQLHVMLKLVNLPNLRTLNPLYINQTQDGNISAASYLDNSECDLHRRSNLYLALGIDPNEAASADGTYTPLITVFKDAAGTIISKPFPLAVYSIKISKNPAVYTVQKDNSSSTLYENTRVIQQIEQLLDTIMRVAIHNNHQVVLLGDLGIHWGHPPAEIARLVRECVTRYPVPYVFICCGDGILDKRDAIYSTLYEHIHKPIMIMPPKENVEEPSISFVSKKKVSTPTMVVRKPVAPKPKRVAPAAVPDDCESIDPDTPDSTGYDSS